MNKRYRLTPDEAEILFRYRGLKAAYDRDWETPISNNK